MRNIVVFCGSSHPVLGETIAKRLGIKLGSVTLGQFSNKETSVQVWESVRDLDVYIIQVILPCFPYARQADAPYKRNGMPRRMQQVDAVTSPATKEIISQSQARKENKLAHLNDGDSPKSTNSEHVPIFGGGVKKKIPEISTISPENGVETGDHLEIRSTTTNQQRLTLIASPIQPPVTSLGLTKTGYKHWVARSGTLIANMITAAGANHVITMDLHDPQYQGFFDIPVDNLYGAPLMIKYIREKIPDYKKSVIVSPDAGGSKRASSIAHKLGVTFALIHKERKYGNNVSPTIRDTSEISSLSLPLNSLDHNTLSDIHHSETDNMVLVGDVKDRICILIDDIADTSRTITKAARILHENGANTIYAIVTHGVLSGDAPDRIKDSKIDVLIVSNSVPQDEALKNLGDRLRVFDVGGIFAEAIRRVHHGESVSYLYEPVDI